MPGMLKVGKTSKTSEQRTAELSAPTGVPCDFVVAFDVLVTDIDEAEKRAHASLAAYRVNENREFFRVGVKTVISVLTALEREFQVQHPKQTPVCSGSVEDFIFGHRLRDSPRVAVESGKQDAPSDPRNTTYDELSAWDLAEILGSLFSTKDRAVAASRRLIESDSIEDLIFAPRPRSVQLSKRQCKKLAAAEAGDTDAMVRLAKQCLISGNGNVARKWLLEAARHGRADACYDLGKLLPISEDTFHLRFALFWIAVSAGDNEAWLELSKNKHKASQASIEQMREFARKLNPKLECKDLF